ncbi:DUF6792 domain-containing protein [Bacillus sp. T33-2]|uniref:DUF6792 domain-containing protein n=1 Tax=Bacillus sp. T33-2 TaxID=2054168 RepID=UPI000C766DA9|nr:DUF6792 domain-containing protein [Bacillus sp. T33-2]PLR96519.1 hypothetical protein CVD19_11025 [Bacillus sp. T33-2]
MKNEEILNTDILRARIAEVEYGKSGKITVEQIRKIIIEESGQAPSGEITVYRSADIKEISNLKISNKDSGFDGTVIHFYDPRKGINQSYTITRGSEGSEDNGEGDPLDWIYNGLGIFEGKIKNQYEHASRFDTIVTLKINEKIKEDIRTRNENGEQNKPSELKKIGIGHSLGGNLIQMLQLMSGSFVKVHAINDAPPSAYQLALVDIRFKRKLSKEFGINPSKDDQLYSIPPAELKKFTEEYYKEKGKNIHHLTAEEDMLFAARNIRGFLDLGTRNVIDTDPGFDGIKHVVDRISDKDLQVQVFLAPYAPAYQQNGLEGLIRAMTGYDKELLTLIDTIEQEWDQLKDGPDWRAITVKVPVGGPIAGINMEFPVFAIPEMPTELLMALNEFAKRLAEISVKLRALAEQLPTLLNIVGDLLPVLGEKIMSYVKEIQGHLNNILESIGEVAGLIAEDILSFDKPDYARYLVGLLKTAAVIKVETANIREKINKILESPLEIWEDIQKAVHAHGVSTVATALALEQNKSRRYEGGDMILMHSGEKIEVNLSSSVRVYQIGMDKYEQKADLLDRIKEAYYRDYIDDFQDRKQRLINEVHYMESNPHAFSYLLPTGNVEMRGISVHEQIRPLESSFMDTFEDMFNYYDKEREEGVELLRKMRSAIEQLFDEDKNISAIFDLR